MLPLQLNIPMPKHQILLNINSPAPTEIISKHDTVRIGGNKLKRQRSYNRFVSVRTGLIRFVCNLRIS